MVDVRGAFWIGVGLFVLLVSSRVIIELPPCKRVLAGICYILQNPRKVGEFSGQSYDGPIIKSYLHVFKCLLQGVSNVNFSFLGSD